MDYIACQASLPVEFSSQEYWSGLSLPILGNLPDPGIQPMSLASPALTGGFFTTEPPGKPQYYCTVFLFTMFPPYGILTESGQVILSILFTAISQPLEQ